MNHNISQRLLSLVIQCLTMNLDLGLFSSRQDQAQRLRGPAATLFIYCANRRSDACSDSMRKTPLCLFYGGGGGGRTAIARFVAKWGVASHRYVCVN